MTVDQMRAILGLGPEFSDAYVVQAYAEYVDAGGAASGDIELISLAMVKKHLRIETDDDSEDDLLALYRDAAIGHLDGRDGWLGRALVEQIYVQTFDCFDRVGRLPYPPLVSVTGVEQRDAGAWLPILSDAWDVVDGALVPATGTRWPSGAARITYRAGYDPAAGRPLPKALQAAVLLITGDLYEGRTTSTAPISKTASVLLQPFRVFRL